MDAHAKQYPPLSTPKEWRHSFPALALTPYGKPMTYLDSAASAQKPQAVIRAITRCYESGYSNVHRGEHYLGERATIAFEGTRDAVQLFMNAKHREEIIFTHNATEAINLVAMSYGTKLQKGQAVVISQMEHHSNLVPWQMLRDRMGIELRVVSVEDDGQILLEKLQSMLDKNVALVALTHVSNVLGTVNPIAEIVRLSHAVGAKILIDGSQAAPHMPIDVQALDADFYAFTGHKIFGPSGVGILYGKKELLEDMPPFLGGGEMISTVTFEKSEWAVLPYKFEAGTPSIAPVVGLHAAIDFIHEIGFLSIMQHEAHLCRLATERLKEIKGLRIIGEAPGKAAVISFVIDGAHAHDIATLVDKQGVAVRAGLHCAEPLLRRFGVSSSIRASFALYNNEEDIDRLIHALQKARSLLVR